MADFFGWSLFAVNAVTFCLLLAGMNRLRQLQALARAKHIAAENRCVAFDSLLREVQLVYVDAKLAHEAVEWEVLQVEQVRGRRVH